MDVRLCNVLENAIMSIQSSTLSYLQGGADLDTLSRHCFSDDIAVKIAALKSSSPGEQYKGPELGSKRKREDSDRQGGQSPGRGLIHFCAYLMFLNKYFCFVIKGRIQIY